MNKSPGVKSIRYPNKIKRDGKNKTFGFLEPTRKNMYDVLIENFDIADRKTFLHRLIIVGEHSFGKDEQIVDLFSDTVKQANAIFHYEKVTGILLYYSKYFVHMVEGDEDSIHQQLKFLYSHKLFHKLGAIKVLIHLSHIKQRLASDWTHYYGQPAELVEPINPNCSISESSRHVYTCIRKFYNFMEEFIEDFHYDEMVNDSVKGHHIEHEGMGLIFQRADSTRNVLQSKVITSYRVNPPETELLDFLVKSVYTQTLDEYYSLYGVVPQRDIYKDKVWPVPSDFIPYDIFSTPYCIVMDISEGRRTEFGTKKSVKVSEDGTPDNFQKDMSTRDPIFEIERINSLEKMTSFSLDFDKCDF